MYLEDVSVELAELVLEGLALREHALLVSEQPVLAHAHQLHLVGQTQDLVQFPLAAVLRRHLNFKKIIYKPIFKIKRNRADLVFAPPANVPDERELRLGQVVLGEALVELIHRQVDDVVHRDRNVHRPSALLVPTQVLFF